ncbi:MAG: hypothetical protein JW768_14240 [Chitinispirillaceae bacterium]|nr:hypothetical protein [Chitinispirillaceae bacterium]
MNVFDLVRADGGGSLLPILIFIIWIVVSLIGNSNAKKKRRMLEEKQRRDRESEPEPDPQYQDRDSVERPPSSPKTEERHERSVFDDLARELDIIVDDEPEHTDVPVSRQGEERPISEEFIRYENHETALAPIGSSINGSDAGTRQEEESVAASAITDAPSRLHMVPRFSVSTEDLNDARRGMVWAEILAPPKALREENPSLTFFF